MNWLKMLLPALVLTGYALPAQAQFFARKPRLANLQVPELIVTAKGDPDERKRVAAIEQLRESDAKSYPDILPVLIDVMLNDPKSGVRLEAVNSLARMRPITQTVGQALQQAAAHDDNFRVRWQARSTLWVNGYHGGSKDNQYVAPTGPSLKEPPLGTGTVIVNPQLPPQPSIQPSVPVIVPALGTPLPTSAVPDTTPRQMPNGNTVSMPRPLPSAPPGFTTAVPQQPTPVRATTPPPTDDGPTIIPVP
jgi:HEAT repeats